MAFVRYASFSKSMGWGAKASLSLAPTALHWREHSRCCLRHTFKSWLKNVYNSLVQLLPCICSNSLCVIPQSTVEGCLSYLIQLPYGWLKAMSDSQHTWAQNVCPGRPVYEVKWEEECVREGWHSHQLFNIQNSYDMKSFCYLHLLLKFESYLIQLPWGSLKGMNEWQPAQNTHRLKMFALGCLFMKQNAYVPENRNQWGRVATPTRFSIFNSYDMKSLWFRFSHDIFTGFKLARL